MFWRTILWDWTHVTHSRMQLSEKVGGGSSGAICWGQESCVMCWSGAGVTVKHSTVAAVGPEERKAFQSEGHTETAGRGISVWGFFFCFVAVWTACCPLYSVRVGFSLTMFMFTRKTMNQLCLLSHNWESFCQECPRQEDQQENGYTNRVPKISIKNVCSHLPAVTYKMHLRVCQYTATSLSGMQAPQSTHLTTACYNHLGCWVWPHPHPHHTSNWFPIPSFYFSSWSTVS